MKQRLIQKEFESIGCYSLEIVGKGQLYEVYNHYLHYSVLCLLVQEQQMCLHWYSSIHGMDLNLIKLQTTLFLCAGNRQRLFYTSI